MASYATAHHPLAQIAQLLQRVVTARDSVGLKRLLCGENLPSFSRDGNEPAELCWLAIRRFMQPQKPWLTDLATLTAVLVSELADALTSVQADREASVVGYDVRRSEKDANSASDADNESYVYNLFLLASFQPSHRLLFDQLSRFRVQEFKLPVLLKQRAAPQFHTALRRQQTDSRFVDEWLGELKSLCIDVVNLPRQARTEALALWQGLIWAPPTADGSDELNRPLLMSAITALAGPQADAPDPGRVNMLQSALDELEGLYPHAPDFWRDFFSISAANLQLQTWILELGPVNN